MVYQMIVPLEKLQRNQGAQIFGDTQDSAYATRADVEGGKDFCIHQARLIFLGSNSLKAISTNAKALPAAEMYYSHVSFHQRLSFGREKLKELDIPFKHPIAKTGIVATIGTNKNPKIALRSDIDALPIRVIFDLSSFKNYDSGFGVCGSDMPYQCLHYSSLD